jgi:hypothetical protein
MIGHSTIKRLIDAQENHGKFIFIMYICIRKQISTP